MCSCEATEAEKPTYYHWCSEAVRVVRLTVTVVTCGRYDLTCGAVVGKVDSQTRGPRFEFFFFFLSSSHFYFLFLFHSVMDLFITSSLISFSRFLFLFFLSTIFLFLCIYLLHLFHLSHRFLIACSLLLTLMSLQQ